MNKHFFINIFCRSENINFLSNKRNPALNLSLLHLNLHDISQRLYLKILIPRRL